MRNSWPIPDPRFNTSTWRTSALFLRLDYDYEHEREREFVIHRPRRCAVTAGASSFPTSDLFGGSRPRIREPLLTFVLVLKSEGFMTTSSLLDSRCNPLPSPILITDSGGAHRFIALANHLDIRALKCHNFYQFSVSNCVNPLQAL